MHLLHELQRAGRLAERPELEPVRKTSALPSTRGTRWGFDKVIAGTSFYEPAEEGRWALITAAWEDGELVDLIATSPRTRAMRRRTGLAQMLGAPWIDVAEQTHLHLSLRASAWRWWASGFFGTVILDWALATALLRDVPAIGCDSEALALRVRRAFAEAGRCPDLFVLEPQEPGNGHRQATASGATSAAAPRISALPGPG
jgi:hypothetical protein